MQRPRRNASGPSRPEVASLGADGEVSVGFRLAHRPTLDRLADRVRFVYLLGEIERISDPHYGGHTPRPDGGFADSPAFAPERGTPARAWIEESYAISPSLLSPAERQPGIGSVLKRVAEQRDLL